MSAIGRIFIVLNLILSAAFLGWAAQAMGSADNYKEQLAQAVADQEAALAEKENELSALRVQKNDAQEEGRGFRDQRDQATAAKDGLESQLAEAKRANAAMQGELANIASTLGDYNDTIAQLTREKDAATQRAHEAENERDDATQSAQDAEMARRDAAEAKEAADVEIASLQEDSTRLDAKISELEATISTIVAVTGVDPSNVTVVPQLEASVLSSRTDLDPGLVMLNKGKADGVKRGWTFHIYRGGRYKGQVRVEDVQDKFCSAVVVGLHQGEPITTGDMATTVL